MNQGDRSQRPKTLPQPRVDSWSGIDWPMRLFKNWLFRCTCRNCVTMMSEVENCFAEIWKVAISIIRLYSLSFPSGNYQSIQTPFHLKYRFPGSGPIFTQSRQSTARPRTDCLNPNPNTLHTSTLIELTDDRSMCDFKGQCTKVKLKVWTRCSAHVHVLQWDSQTKEGEVFLKHKRMCWFEA